MAITVKTRARALLRDARALLGEKALPKEVHEALDALEGALRRTWADLESEAGEGDPSTADAAAPSAQDDNAEGDAAVAEAAGPLKTEGGTAYPASDFAFVPDPEKPSTWKLRLTSTPGGDPDPAIVGAAAAALGPGYRGQKVQLPADQVAQVKAKVRAAWRKANPDKDDTEMPEGIRESWDAGTRGRGDTGTRGDGDAGTRGHGDTGRRGRGDTGTLREARNVGQWFEAEIHRNFTMLADSQFGEGMLTREERIGLSSCIGEALDAFARKLAEVAPGLYERDPYLPVPPLSVPPAQPMEAVVMGEADSSLGTRGVESRADDPLRMTSERLGEIVPLVERAVRADGTTRIKVIDAGWGTSGYYPADVLKRDGPQVFKAGTHMFVDHPTVTEEAERPERSLQDLGAVLVTDARWEDDPTGGPGLYAQAKVFSSFQPVLEELAPHIGVSVNADGVVREGEAEGRRGRVVDRLRSAQSIDFVTKAGRGGKVMALYEAARAGRGDAETRGRGDAEIRGRGDAEIRGHGDAEIRGHGEGDMTEDEIRVLQEAKGAAEAEVARLREALLLRESMDVAAAELAKIEMPDLTRARLAEAQGRKPVVVDGKLDREAFATQVREAATAELAYLAEATGAGRITGMGSSGNEGLRDEDAEKRLAGAFLELGLSESLAQKAARGR